MQERKLEPGNISMKLENSIKKEIILTTLRMDSGHPIGKTERNFPKESLKMTSNKGFGNPGTQMAM